MDKKISHNLNDETPEAKARWFQSLPINERIELLNEYTDMILEINPKITEQNRAQPIKGRIRIVSQA